ncbi:MAG: hypothetical protein JSR82_04205 [Verrucomicrobia bacterium]|nr:hypothetical protein [Verrucomicrobiota bacterium]
MESPSISNEAQVAAGNFDAGALGSSNPALREQARRAYLAEVGLGAAPGFERVERNLAFFLASLDDRAGGPKDELQRPAALRKGELLRSVGLVQRPNFEQVLQNLEFCTANNHRRATVSPGAERTDRNRKRVPVERFSAPALTEGYGRLQGIYASMVATKAPYLSMRGSIWRRLAHRLINLGWKLFGNRQRAHNQLAIQAGQVSSQLLHALMKEIETQRAIIEELQEERAALRAGELSTVGLSSDRSGEGPIKLSTRQ